MAGRIGHLLQPLLAPIGFNWQMTVALIPGFAAREVAVAALGTVYAIGNADAAPGALATTLQHHWSIATGLAFLAWYVFAPQCASTLGRGEARDQLLALAGGDAGLHDGLAYVAALHRLPGRAAASGLG